MAKHSTHHNQHQLEAALQQHTQYLKRLNTLTVIAAVVIAVLLCVIIANQNFYSIIATLLAGMAFFMAASIYRVSLIVMVPVILIYCLADNYLSHHMNFQRQHFMLQFGALVGFTSLFNLSRPYLLNILRLFLTSGH